jgi:hypothetical protein
MVDVIADPMSVSARHKRSHVATADAVRLPANIVQDTRPLIVAASERLTWCLFCASKSDPGFPPKHMAQATFRELLLPR